MTDSVSKKQRQDQGLGQLLQYENVAWYQEGLVRILDRRVYPAQIHFVECRSVAQVADAIRDMVTQSAGPYTAAGMGMALAAWQARGKGPQEQIRQLEAAAAALSGARPTTRSRMQKITDQALQVARSGLDQGQGDLSRTLFQLAFDSLERRYRRMGLVGQHLVSLFPERIRLMTHCYGETILGTMIRAAKDKGIQMALYCPETRPYLQGARLTASLAADMGMDVTVITDNMAAQVMSMKKVDMLTTAADVICREGYVVNKVGTLQLAILAKYHGIPYFVTGIPDASSVDQVQLEERDPRQVLEMAGQRHVKPEVKGYYPAFDVTPPYLVSGLVTDRGLFTPYNLEDYLASGQEEDFYGGSSS